MELADMIDLDEMCEEQRQVAELIGLENYAKLMRVYGGISLYIPKPDKLERMERNQKIKAEFDGGNFKALAAKYGLTETHIRTIVAIKIREIRAKPMEGQTSLL